MMYLLEVNLYLALFALSYYLFLRKQPFFVANRAILLLSILTALLLPLLPGGASITSSIFIPTALAQIQLAPVVVGEASGSHAPSAFGWLQLFTAVYLLGVLVVATRFIMRLLQTIKYIKAGRQRQMDGYTLVEMENGKHAASFFHVLLWPYGPKDEEDKWMLIHEQVHIREWHSVDLILAEIVHIACWWNPAVLYLKRAIEHNNEYRADQVTVRAEKDAKTYSKVLVGKALGVSHTILSHEFSKPNLLKMRLQMLQVTQNPTKRLRYLYLLPVLAIMLFVHACTENTPEPPRDENVEATLRALDSGELELPAGITKEKFIEMIKNGEIKYIFEQPVTPSIGPDSIYTVVDVMPMFPGGQNALMAFLGDNIKYPASAKGDGIEGTVFITFVINEDGTLDQMSALRSPDERLTQAAIDAISAMPAWTPGEQNGTAVPVRYNLPIRFQLDS